MNVGNLLPSTQDESAELIDDLVTPIEVMLDETTTIK